MTIHLHKLEGCSPTPLGSYLKALAVLRLVAEQRDPNVRGFWKDESFWLVTELSREELLSFFLRDYAPTPILSPWNGGSGFFYERDVGLTPIEESVAPRFEAFRRGIRSSRALSAPLAAAMERLDAADKAVKGASKKDSDGAAELKAAKAEKDRLKDQLLGACRRSWEGGLLEWFDAALAIGADGDASWPALLGSGGNDGRLDFTNNSMQHLAVLFACSDPAGIARPEAAPLLAAALFGEPTSGLSRKAVGQFSPGSAGGDNMGAGFKGNSLVNPWDFVLMLEGSVVFASSLVRTADATNLPLAAAPFAVRAAASGYGSAASADEGPRGEQWMPLWRSPALFGEVRALFAEGRTRSGRNTAGSAQEAARAVARLGAARGISHFERFGYIERNGQANLAVPLGRWAVSAQPHDVLLDDVEAWLSGVRRFARDKGAPKSVTAAARALDEAILAVCRAGAEPARWQSLLVALGRAEAALTGSPQRVADPIRQLAPLPILRPAWLSAVDDGSVEFRLAAALASQDVALRTQGGQAWLNVRAHFLPLERSRSPHRAHAPRGRARFAVDGGGLARDPDVVCAADDLERDCIALVRRRVQLAPGLPTRGLGLVGAPGVAASLGDVAAFLTGQVDDRRILALARPLMAIAWWERELSLPEARRRQGTSLDAGYAVARLVHLSTPVVFGEPLTIPIDPEPIARLAAGDLGGALAVALRRLRATGLTPRVRHFVADARAARRLGASLAFPLRAADVRRCVELVIKPQDLEDSRNVD